MLLLCLIRLETPLIGGNAVNALERYELIRPILNREKTPQQVHQETNVPLSTIHRYLSRFRQGGGQIESLADKGHAIHSHPKWLTDEEGDLVVCYKLQHPHESTRQIAFGLAQAGILQIHDRTVAKILKERRLPPLFPTIRQRN